MAAYWGLFDESGGLMLKSEFTEHESWLPLESVAFETNGRPNSVGSTRADKPITGVVFTRATDKASSTLMLYMNSGKHIPKSIIELTKTENGVETTGLSYTLTDVMINGLGYANTGPERKLMETVSISFEGLSYLNGPAMTADRMQQVVRDITSFFNPPAGKTKPKATAKRGRK